MKIALLNTKNTLRARYLLECFQQGAFKHGDTCTWVEDYQNYELQLKEADIGIQVCYPNKHHGDNPQGKFRLDVNNYMAKRGKRIISIDTGFIHNQSDYELRVANQKGQHEVLFDLDKTDTYKNVLLSIYYEVGYDGLKRNADYCTDDKGLDSSRWDKLQVEVKPWRESGNHILLVGQTANGLSSQNKNIYKWYKEVIDQIRKITTKREILYRVHPRIVKIRTSGSRIGKDRRALEDSIGQQKNFRISSNFLIEEDLKDAWCAITFTSNASVIAAVQGIPVFTCDPANVSYDVGSSDLRKINDPSKPDRSVWLNKLAWSQFNCQEIIDGGCWDHLKPGALNPISYKYEWR